MAGLTERIRQRAFIRKLNKQGRDTVGRVADILTQNDMEKAAALFLLPSKHSYIILMTFTTDEGRQEKLVMRTDDISSFGLGAEVGVRYCYEKGVCFALPKQLCGTEDL